MNDVQLCCRWELNIVCSWELPMIQYYYFHDVFDTCQQCQMVISWVVQGVHRGVIDSCAGSIVSRSVWAALASGQLW
jgi:hypothetical protein